jgi:hypothetical protein
VVDLGHGVVTLASVSISLLLLGAILVSVRRQWPSCGGLYLAEASTFIAFEVLSVTLSWQAHAVWLLLPVAVVLLAVHEWQAGRSWLGVAAGVGALAFLSGPYEPPFEYARFGVGWSTLLMAHTTAGALLLLGLCLYLCRRVPSLQPATTEKAMRGGLDCQVPARPSTQ